MFKIYFKNNKYSLKVSINKPLDASLDQTLDIFLNLPHDGMSFMGIITEYFKIEFLQYSKFVWLVEIPSENKDEVYQLFSNKNQTIQLIKKIFEGINPIKIEGLNFIKNKI